LAKILEHKHLIVRAEVRNPPKDTALMEKWMSNMVATIGMVELAPPRAIYSDMEGNRGLTCDVILNTSNAVVHTWDEVDPGIFMLDVYTCGALDPNVIFDLLVDFDPVKIEYMYLDREHGLHILDKGFAESRKAI
jgi:S-adenosylmethionine/arginine decarboxylase-like enzyme